MQKKEGRPVKWRLQKRLLAACVQIDGTSSTFVHKKKWDFAALYLELSPFFTMLDKLPKLLVTQFAKCPVREKEILKALTITRYDLFCFVTDATY